MTMRISTKGCYGLRAMVELAAHHGEAAVSVGDIATHLNISRKYLHALMTALKGAGLVRSQQGCHGGYCLNQAPERIPVLEVVSALEGPTRLRDCVFDLSACERSGTCMTRPMWEELGKLIEARMSEITLQDLVTRSRRRAARRR
jgi:Rrf2 family cysteine metabolism transcriptional repressor